MAYDKIVDSTALDTALTNIADSIRAKTGKTDPLTIEQMPGEIDKIGKLPEWFAYMSAPTFAGVTIDKDLTIDIPLTSCTRPLSIFGNYNNPTTINSGVKITINYAGQTDYMGPIGGYIRWWGNNELIWNVDTSKATGFSGFLGTPLQNDLVAVRGTPIDFSSVVKGEIGKGVFNIPKCTFLRFAKQTLKVSIDLSYCYSLDDESVQSIIDGLADLTGETAQTITLHTDIKSKLTDEQTSAITAKNWTIA